MATLADVPCGHLTFDESRVITGANTEALRLLEREGKTLVGTALAELLSPAGRLFAQTHMFPRLERGGRVDEVYLSFAVPSGELPVLLCARRCSERLEGAAGAPDRATLYELVFLPIHRRALYERELVQARLRAEAASRAEQEALARMRAMQEQLALRDRLASIGTLAAGVGHEINNPLTYVTSNLELVASALEGAHHSIDELRREVTPLLDDACEGVTRIRDIVRGMRSLARVDDHVRAPIELARVIEAALRVCSHEIRTRAVVRLDVEDPSPIVDASEGPLVQVIVNLLLNAAQAMPERDREANHIDVRCRTEPGEGRVLLEIEDNGSGISPEVRQRIFDPFFTTKPVGTGTGLGLAICHQIVTGYGGHFTVTSAAGAGARFAVSLPVSSSVRARPSIVANEAPVAPVRHEPTLMLRRRALVIDDDEGVRKALRRLLKDYDVTVASDGCEGMVRLASEPAPDVVLCDLMMPCMTGMEVYESIARTQPALAQRFVFVTGGGATDAARAFLDRITNPRVDKPFSVAQVRRVCDEVASRAEAPGVSSDASDARGRGRD